MTHLQFVEQFVADLHTYASGAYLREEDKEFWDPPYDPAALVTLRALLEEFVHAEPSTVADGAALIEQLCEFNRAYGYAVIELEEEAELMGFIHRVLTQVGVSEEELKALPEFE